MQMQTIKQDEQQLVVFDLASEGYGVNIGAVREIIRLQDITKVPRTPSFVEGVIDLRGRVVPVINLRKRFALPIAEETKDNRIVVVDIHSQDIGIVVDAVTEVLRISQNAVEPLASVITNADSEYLLGIAKLESRMIILLDLEQLLSESEHESLLDIAQPKVATSKESESTSSSPGPQEEPGLRIDLLEKSFKSLSSRGEEFAAAFYDRLFEKHPEVKPMFAQTDMKEQEKKLLGALALVVNNLRKPDVLGIALRDLGQKHQEMGVLHEHYPIVGGVLLETFAKFIGPKKWTPELEKAWADAYGAVLEGMGV